MKQQPGISRTSAGKAGWAIGVLMIAWLILLFFPSKSAEQPAEAQPRPAPVAELSRLKAVGLDDNVHWENLPDYFPVWADYVDWENDKSAFAYWDPVAQSYAYYFEVTRAGGEYRFRAVSKGELRRQDIYYDHEEGEEPGEEVPEISVRSETHPFVFLSKISHKLVWVTKPVGSPGKAPSKSGDRVEVDLKQQPWVMPQVVIEQSDIHGTKGK